MGSDSDKYLDFQYTEGNPPVFKEPRRWKAVWDKEYNRFFYVDILNNNKSQWEPPSGTVPTNTSDLGNPPPYNATQQQGQRGINQQQPQQQYYPQQQQQQQYYPQQQQQYYPQQQQYYPQQQQQGYYQQQQYYPQQQSSSRGIGTGTMMGVGGGLLGGMLLGEMLSSHHDYGGYGDHGGPPPGGDDFGGGDFGGGDFGGGDF